MYCNRDAAAHFSLLTESISLICVVTVSQLHEQLLAHYGKTLAQSLDLSDVLHAACAKISNCDSSTAMPN